MNHLESRVDLLPVSCRPLWWRVVNDNIGKLTNRSPVAVTNWLLWFMARHAVSEYQLEAGLTLAIKFCCTSRQDLTTAILNPSMLFQADADYEQWKRERIQADRLKRLHNLEADLG